MFGVCSTQMLVEICNRYWINWHHLYINIGSSLVFHSKATVSIGLKNVLRVGISNLLLSLFRFVQLLTRIIHYNLEARLTGAPLEHRVIFTILIYTVLRGISYSDPDYW